MKPALVTKRLHWTLCLVAMALAAVASGCGKSTSGAAESAGAGGGARPPSLVRVAPVVQKEVRPQTVVVGNVTARRTSVVASGADGKVDQFLVREGQIVDDEEPLSILNMVTTDLGISEAKKVLEERNQHFQELLQGSREEEILEAEAKMQAAEVTMRVAADKLERMQQLVRNNAGNKSELDDAREHAEAAAKMHTAAKSSWELVLSGPRAEQIAQAKARRDAQQEQVAYLEAEKGKRFTKAPFPGVVVAEHTERGQWLSKDAPVATVADLLEEVYVIANVDERDLPNVQIGALVQVEIPATTRRVWEGTVLTIVPRSEWRSGSRAFPVKVSVPNEIVTVEGRPHPVLTEGMLARVTFLAPPRPALLVPKDAVIRSEAGSRVYVVIPGERPDVGKARPAVIEEGGSFGGEVEILSGELQPGVQVITEGAERLQPFADIQIIANPPTGDEAAPAETVPENPPS